MYHVSGTLTEKFELIKCEGKGFTPSFSICPKCIESIHKWMSLLIHSHSAFIADCSIFGSIISAVFGCTFMFFLHFLID